MHLSMHNWMRAEPLEVTLERLAKFGYESIELSGEPERCDTAEVRALLHKYNIRCWGAVTLMMGNRNMLAKDEAVRAQSVQYVKDCVTMVKELEGCELTVVPATVGKIEPESTPENEWEWAVAGMREVYVHSEREGVRLAIEPINRFETYFITRGAQALALAKDEAVRAQSVQYVKDCVTMVKELEGCELTVVPATVGKIEPESTPENEWEWAVAGMREVYVHSEREGVRLAIEPINRFETYFITRGAQALALAKATGPHCGVCLDAFHINIEEADPHRAIRDAGDRLVDFHVADNNRMACGLGNWDWAKLVATLKEVGYDGALTVEFVAPIDRTPANEYPHAVETDPVDITPEELKFIQDHGSSLLSEEFYTFLVKKTAETLLPLIA